MKLHVTVKHLCHQVSQPEQEVKQPALTVCVRESVYVCVCLRASVRVCVCQQSAAIG